MAGAGVVDARRKVAAICLVALAALLFIATGCETSREGRLQEVLRYSRAAPERTVELESPFLSDPDPDVRALAVWAIGDSQASNALAALMPVASDPDPAVRAALAKALCALPDPAALDPVVSLSSDPDGGARRAAVRCLASSSAPPSAVIARAIGDEDRETRAIALDSLLRHPDPAAIPALQRLFESGSVDDQVAVVAAFRAVRDPSPLPILETAAASRLPLALRDAVEAAIVDLRAARSEAEKAAASAQEAVASTPETAPPSTPPPAPARPVEKRNRESLNGTHDVISP